MIIRTSSAALAGAIGSLKKLNEEDFLKQIREGFKKAYKEEPSPEQINAWHGSWKHVKKLFHTLPDNAIGVFEYRLPFEQQRIDLAILGTDKSGKNNAIVLELKGWKKVKFLNSNYLIEADGKKRIHPDLQTADYIGKLKYAHSEADRFNFIGIVWMYNFVRDNVFSKTFKENLCFFKNEEEYLYKHIKNFVCEGIPEKEATAFLNGTYRQTRQLFQAIRENFESLQRGALEALAAQGFAPSEEQLSILEEIIEAVKLGTPTTFLVKGSAGSGKTYIAILLLLKTLSSFQVYGGNVRNLAVLSFRNNRLLNTVRRLFQSFKSGLDSVVKFYSTGRGYGIAEQDVKSPDFLLVIYDEAQRLEKNLAEKAVKRGVVTVFFYDENQILNLDELQNIELIKNAAKKNGRKLVEKELSYVYRVRGGKEYHDFVERLLKNPLSIGKISKFVDYEFRVFSDIEEMLKALKEKRDKEGAHVALVAAFTESPGDRKNKTGKTLKNLRVGYPLYSGFDLYKGKNIRIYWLMDEKIQYPNFWLNRESNKLTHCASIYGCQGFEADYVGVIWGRDMVWRTNKWEIGTACEDTIGKPKSLKELIKEKNPDALKLLQNRYRIFLTRGIRGTYVFCEDKETLKFLLSLCQ